MGNVNEVSFFGGIAKLVQAPFKLLGNAGAGVVSLATGDTEGFKNGVAGMGNSIFDAVEAPLNVAVDVLEVPKSLLGGTSDKKTTSVEKIAFGTGNVMDVPIGVVELGEDIVNSLRPERKGFFDKVSAQNKESEKKPAEKVTNTTTATDTKTVPATTTDVKTMADTKTETKTETKIARIKKKKIKAKRKHQTKTVISKPVQQKPENKIKSEEKKPAVITPKAPEKPKEITAKPVEAPKNENKGEDKKADTVIVPLPLPVDTNKPDTVTTPVTKTTPVPAPKNENKDEDKKKDTVIVPLPLPVDTNKPATTTASTPTNPPSPPVAPAPAPSGDNNSPSGNGTPEPKTPVNPLPDTPKTTDKYKTARRIVLGLLAGAALFLIFKNRGAIIKGIKGIFSKAPATGIQTNPNIAGVAGGVPEQKLLTFTPPVTTPPTGVTPPAKPPVDPFVTTKHVPLEQRVTPIAEAEKEALKKKLTRKITLQEDKMWSKHTLQQTVDKQDAILRDNLAEKAAKKAKQAEIDKQMEEMFAQRQAQLKAQKAKEVKAAWAEHTHEANLEKGRLNAAKKKEIQDFLSSPQSEVAAKPSVKPQVKPDVPKPTEIGSTLNPANPKLDGQKARDMEDAFKKHAQEIAEKQAQVEAEAAKKLEHDMAKKAKVAAQKAEAKKAKEIEDAWAKHSKAAADAKAQVDAQTAKEIEEYLSTQKPTVVEKVKSATSKTPTQTEISSQMDEMFAQRKAQIEARKAKEVEAAWAEYSKAAQDTTVKADTFKPTPITTTPKPKIAVSPLPKEVAQAPAVTPKVEVKPEVKTQVANLEPKPTKVVIPDTGKITPEQLTVGQKVKIRMNRNTSDSVVSTYKSAFCSIMGSKENAIRKHQFLTEIEITPTNLGQIKKLYKYLDILAA